MDSEDRMCSHASSGSDDLSSKGLDVDGDAKDNDHETEEVVVDVEEGVFAMEDLGQPEERNQDAHATVTDVDKKLSAQTPVQSVKMVESLSVSQSTKVDDIHSDKTDDDDDDDDATVKDSKELGRDEKRGVKSPRPRDDCDLEESSVRVVYTSLPSQSKRKLEELLRQWSKWHAQKCGSAQDLAESLESGEETYFPALHVGSEKSSTVSFSMDIPVAKRQRKESLSLNLECSPLYDREYAVGLASDAGSSEERGTDLREAPRCFNCGSYNHPLSGCQKPVNKTAVNSARKEFQSKKNQNGGPRVLTRYYQESPAGKFDGLKPGALSAETRKLLGLEELDPPPWLNRMRELGYPPGYLDPEEEDQPSGITIFGDEEPRDVDLRNGLQLDARKSQKKMLIEFPGINSPIPNKADRERWAPPRAPPVFDPSWNQSNNRWSNGQGSMINGNFHSMYGPRNHTEASSYHFSLGLSPPLTPQPYNYHPSDPFSPRGLPLPPSPQFWRPPEVGRPYLHRNYGSF